MILTKNENNILRFLATHYREDHSINEIGKKCEVSSAGAHKILSKLEREGVLKIKHIANMTSYSLDFERETARSILTIAFLPEDTRGRLSFRTSDVLPLKKITRAFIIFGSYITTKRSPNDLDILCIIDKKKFREYKKVLETVQEKTPIHIHDVIQTRGDIKKSIEEKNPVILEALQKGAVLWGAKEIVEVIQKCSQKK